MSKYVFKFKEVRESIGMTLETLAELSEISIERLDSIEKNEITPSVSEFFQLIDALKACPHFVYEVKEEGHSD